MGMKKRIFTMESLITILRVIFRQHLLFVVTFSRGMSRALDRICMESAIVTSQDLADEIHIGAVPPPQKNNTTW